MGFLKQIARQLPNATLDNMSNHVPTIKMTSSVSLYLTKTIAVTFLPHLKCHVNERCVCTYLELVFEHFEEFLPDDLLLALPHR